MNLLLRLIRVLLTIRSRGALAPFQDSVLSFRVWPGDLDLNVHMNNGRYLTVMDLGRLDLMARTGLLREAVRRRWMPLVGSAVIRFRRSLALFQRYELRSRILGWDHKWFFMEQRFLRGGDLIAVGLVKGLVRGRSGNVSPAEVLVALGRQLESPPLSDAVLTWSRLERSMLAEAAAPDARSAAPTAH